ncbi:hypothetical protein GCM10011273_14850 [Asticcacaulis endophyticus]|uniref:Uncharacterized protein n=2 Tax=Asticcacaulis endophyticus TaxID=1395890 RepID=A0A918URW7_9CAUL|nr:hypothetical protein GCM10011273_14850 [Asticcacaulis endophyticus]
MPMSYIANNSQLRYDEIDTYSDPFAFTGLSHPVSALLDTPHKKEADMLGTPAIKRSTATRHSIIPDLSLDDLLNDEMTRMVMEVDEVDEDNLREMLSLTAESLRLRLS